MTVQVDMPDGAEFTATVNEAKAFDTGFAAVLAEGNAWFPQLSAAKQAEVVKYAVLHIANNSSLFERNEHGGNYQEYERLTIAIARSGVPEAEAIFVEAASSAKDADPEDDLRNFFRTFTCDDQDNDGITVGTLLNAARHCGPISAVGRRLPLAPLLTLSSTLPATKRNAGSRLTVQ